MRKVNRANLGVLCSAVIGLSLGASGIALGADASAPDAGCRPHRPPQPGSVQAVMAMAAKVAQEQLAEKKKKDEEERLRGFGGDWESWTADNSVADIASLQRGLRDFAGYCRGCHALKYVRYSRLADDLQITPEQLQKFLLPAGCEGQRLRRHADAVRGCADLVRQGAAGSVADRACPRHRLPVPVPDDVLRGPVARDGRQ